MAEGIHYLHACITMVVPILYVCQCSLVSRAGLQQACHGVLQRFEMYMTFGFIHVSESIVQGRLQFASAIVLSLSIYILLSLPALSEPGGGTPVELAPDQASTGCW